MAALAFEMLLALEALGLDAKSHNAQKSINTDWESLGFVIQTQHWVVPAEKLIKVGPCPIITPLPSSPTWLKGLINLGGELIHALDLSMLISHQPLNIVPGRTQILVIKEAKMHLALLVEKLIHWQRFAFETRLALTPELFPTTWEDSFVSGYFPATQPWWILKTETLTKLLDTMPKSL